MNLFRKKNYVLALSLLNMFIFAQKHQASKIDIKESSARKKMKIVFCVVHTHQSENDSLNRIGSFVADMLSRHEQQLSGFDVSIRICVENPNNMTIGRLKNEGFPLAVFFSNIDKKHFEWRLYDTYCAHMLKGGKHTAQEHDLQILAEKIANELWRILTGQEGFFSTKIAFCKKNILSENKEKTDICFMPPYRSKFSEYPAQTVLVENAKAFALRWNRNQNKPILFYSEGTPCNVRLVSTTLQGKRNIVSNFKGINVLPSFACGGTKIAYCLSKGEKTSIFLYKQSLIGGYTVQEITHNGGNNTSPNLCDNGDIIFCSDFESKNPQIYYYHEHNKEIERITKGGYCAAPSFCPKNQKIVYCKLSEGLMQLFVYDYITKKHYQITKDSENKDQCSWSSCGNYIVFCASSGLQSRIKLLNFLTNECVYLTCAKEHCSYPAWS